MPGTHVTTPRAGYLHHGVYAGGGKVIHYRGYKQLFRRCPVEEVDVAGFTRGRPLLIRALPATPSEGLEAVRHARSRLGENRYRLLTNNCRHFAEWCRSQGRDFAHGY